mgnify:FL=1
MIFFSKLVAISTVFTHHIPNSLICCVFYAKVLLRVNSILFKINPVRVLLKNIKEVVFAIFFTEIKVKALRKSFWRSFIE